MSLFGRIAHDYDYDSLGWPISFRPAAVILPHVRTHLIDLPAPPPCLVCSCSGLLLFEFLDAHLILYFGVGCWHPSSGLPSHSMCANSTRQPLLLDLLASPNHSRGHGWENRQLLHLQQPRCRATPCQQYLSSAQDFCLDCRVVIYSSDLSRFFSLPSLIARSWSCWWTME